MTGNETTGETQIQEVCNLNNPQSLSVCQLQRVPLTNIWKQEQPQQSFKFLCLALAQPLTQIFSKQCTHCVTPTITTRHTNHN
jgi:hypothetical protein